MRRWLKRRRKIRELQSLEVYLFNYGPPSKWIQVRDSNNQLGVWNGTYKLPKD